MKREKRYDWDTKRVSERERNTMKYINSWGKEEEGIERKVVASPSNKIQH